MARPKKSKVESIDAEGKKVAISVTKTEIEQAQILAAKLQPAPDNRDLTIEELTTKNIALAEQVKELKAPKGIPSIVNSEGTIKRPDEAMKESLPSALSKTKPEDLTVPEKIVLERELRRYVRRSGGFRKHLPEKAQARAEKIMKIIGRTKPEWDETIDVPGFNENLKGKGDVELV